MYLLLYEPSGNCTYYNSALFVTIFVIPCVRHNTYCTAVNSSVYYDLLNTNSLPPIAYLFTEIGSTYTVMIKLGHQMYIFVCQNRTYGAGNCKWTDDQLKECKTCARNTSITQQRNIITDTNHVTTLLG